MYKSKNVLLIEDDKDDQLFFKEALEEIDNVTLYAVANNGREALDILDKNSSPPDIIFMDINMPLMDGIECLTEMGKSTRIKDIPVVMLTTDRGKMSIIQKLGVKAFIEKPSNQKTLRQKIEQMLNLDYTVENPVANQSFSLM